jgi:polar amino acid transport system substrate-binding protein
MVEDTGEVGGLSTIMVREMFRRTGIPFVIDLQPWARAYKTAQSEENTCVYSTTRTPARENQFKWVGPLLQNVWALYAGPHSPAHVQSLEQVRPYIIGGYNGDAVAQYLIGQGLHVELSPSDDLNPRKLLAGHIDYWATSIYRFNYLLKHNDTTALTKVLEFNSVMLYLACNPKVPDAKIARLNAAIDAMHKDGFSERERRRYLVK